MSRRPPLGDSLIAYLSTLAALVALTVTAAVIVSTLDAERKLPQIVGALGFIGAAVTGLIGVIGTFRPKGDATASTNSGDVNLSASPPTDGYTP